MTEIQLTDLYKIIFSIIAGGLIGFEREYRDKSAGLRTLMFISIGTTLFTILSMRYTSGDPSRVAAALVSGIGFIGTGVIVHNRGQITGITTAAVIWVTAGIGMSIGLGLYYIAVMSLLIVLMLLWIFSAIEFNFTPQKENIRYIITIENDDTLFSLIKSDLLKFRLKIFEESYEKENNRLIIHFTIIASKKVHNYINKYFIENSKIEKCKIL